MIRRRPPTVSEQLALGLPVSAAMGRADFLEAPPNALALAAIEDPAGLPGGRLILHGPAGTGKTHLARIWAERNAARWIAPQALAEDLPALLRLPSPAAMVLDDADTLAGGQAEEALFHLLNHQRASGGELLMTGPAPARDWGVRLPDLASRLAATAHVALAEPDDALLSAVLVKLFNDRQIRVNPALIDYLLARMERSLATAGDMVARLDARAMALGRPVNRQLAQEILADDLDNEGP